MSLLHLRVHNLGVLDEAAIDPSNGLTVVTGETGAGKTLLLGGLRLILGEKADSGSVGPHGDAAHADGLFSLEDGTEVGASRVVPREGRSRGYLDGAIVSTQALSESLGSIVEIIGQHDQVSMSRASRLLDVVDSVLGTEGLDARREYDLAWNALVDALARLSRLGGDTQELARELDLARYQVAEIHAARLTDDLDVHLEAQASRLRNAHETQEHLAEVQKIVDRVAEDVGEIVDRTRKAASLDPTLSELGEGAETVAADVADLAREARSASESVESDPERLTDIEERLTAIGDLKRKYGRTIEEVLAYGKTTADRADEIERLLAEADRIDEVVDSARAGVTSAAARLTETRTEAARLVSERALSHLADLGLGTASLEMTVGKVDPGPSGADRLELLFASDTRLDPGPVSAVASGGELSRLVLALRLATAGQDTTTLVFDEIDTGIGGTTALAMGQKLADLAERFQVLCVTHLPQVAAHADSHFVVTRTAEGTAVVAEVSGEARLVELSRMLAGQPESDTGKLAAAELLEIASG
ncbi:MAG: AAA family ATPase [Acidimicrobiia bacterium]|jgi:DNA repair protein RecN (Recombination protein N)